MCTSLAYCWAIRWQEYENEIERMIKSERRQSQSDGKTEPKLKFVRCALQCIYIMISFRFSFTFSHIFFFSRPFLVILTNAGTYMANNTHRSVPYIVRLVPSDRNALRTTNK